MVAFQKHGSWFLQLDFTRWISDDDRKRPREILVFFWIVRDFQPVLEMCSSDVTLVSISVCNSGL